MSKVLDFYMSLLPSFGVTFSEAGVVLKPDSEVPFQIEGKDLVLPTKLFLDQNDWTEVHPFHPLCEDPLMGQSATYHFLLRCWRANTTVKFCQLIHAILDIAKDKDKAKSVKNPLWAKLPIADANEKTAALWGRLRKKFAAGQPHFIKLHVLRNGTIEDTKFQRTATIEVPLLETEKGNPLGVQGNITDSDTIRELVRYLLEPLLVDYGSNHDTPYLDILLQIQQATLQRYNELLEVISDVHELTPMPGDWLPFYPDLSKLRKIIPRLPGNDGVRIDDAPRNRGIEPDKSLYDEADVAKKDDTPPWDERDSKEAKVPTKSGASVDDLLSSSRRERRRDDDVERSDRRDRRRDDGLFSFDSDRRDRRRDDDRRDRRRGGASVLDFL